MKNLLIALLFTVSAVSAQAGVGTRGGTEERIEYKEVITCEDTEIEVTCQEMSGCNYEDLCSLILNPSLLDR